MEVRILVGYEAAYACIKTPGVSVMDVRLHAGRSAQKSLRETAKEQREKAARLIRQAELMEAAAVHLDEQKMQSKGGRHA